MQTFGPDRVRRISSLDITAHAGPWTYAENHREAIDAHWKIATAANPGFFNGTIHVVTALDVAAEHARGRFMPIAFKNFLYWRDEGFPAEAGVRDGFGSALIRSAEGYMILGRQRAGNINGGLAYLPGGFIDHRDVDSAGRIDILASVARELREETGLGEGMLERAPGILVTEAGPHVSFGIPYRSSLAADELVARIEAFIASDPNSELAETVLIRRPKDIEGLAMPHYARVLIGSPLAWQQH